MRIVAIGRPLLFLLLFLCAASVRGAELQLSADEQAWLRARDHIEVATFAPG